MKKDNECGQHTRKGRWTIKDMKKDGRVNYRWRRWKRKQADMVEKGDTREHDR